MAVKTLSDRDMNGRRAINNGAPIDDADGATKLYADTGDAAARSRANHTGTQTAATISDFDTQVRTSRLNQMTAPDGAVALGGQQLTGLADGSAASHAVSKGQLDAAVAATAAGLVFKGAVRAVSAANVDVASAPVNIDGIAATAGEVFLLTAQTTGPENGPWVWSGTAVAMTRPSNFDTDPEAIPGSLWVVQAGTRGNQLAILDNDVFDLGTTVGTFTFFDPTAGGDNDTGYAEDCPVTSAGAAWPVNHNLGTKDVQVSVRRVGSPFDEVDCNVTFDTANQVNLRPDIALAAAEFRAVVSKVV